MITIISSTNRPESNSGKIAVWLSNKLNNSGVEAQTLHLADLPADFAYQKIRKNTLPEFDDMMTEKIANVNKFIFIIPEYNGSYPGALKSFIDSVPPSHFYHKKAALIGISSGRTGALKALDDFTGVLHYLQVEVLSDKPKISSIESVISSTGTIEIPEIIHRIDKHLAKFMTF